MPINGKIYKINSETGKRHKEFGNKGSIDSSTVTAPIIYNNFLIIVLVDKKAVNVFDKNDGRFLFQIPLFDERRNFVGGTPWGGVAFDEKNGIVFVTTGNPQPSLYGVNRKGDNFRSNSIIAVDINLRKIIWEFQETFHDLWDYDVCSPPILHDLRIGDKTIETVIALTKVGNTIILERKTGKPLYDLNYKKVDFISDIPGEITSSYQLNLKLPEKFHSIEITNDDFSQLKTTDKNRALKTLKNSYYGSFYPPSFNRFLITKGLHGGAEWQGGTLDPQNQFLYIPVNNVAWKLRPIMQTVENKIDKALKNHIGYKLYQTNCSSCHQKNRNGIYKKSGEKLTKYVPSLVGLSIVNKNYKDFFNKKILEHPSKIKISTDEKNKIWDLFNRWDLTIYKKKAIRVRADGKAWSQFLNDDDTPAINPPWGYLAKLDLTNGKIVWKKPIGMKIINGKEIQIGTPNFGGAAVNAGNVIFYTGTDDNYAYAINSKNGNIIWKYKMDAAGSAPPIIYELEGKQYVSFLSTGGQYHNYKEKGSTLYTFGIK